MALRVVSALFVIGMLVAGTSTLMAADAAPGDYAQQIVKLIGESDREFRAAGLEQVRTAAKGAASTQLFAAQLAKLDAEGQIALLDALADRGDQEARPAVLGLLASSPDASVRAAAIGALGLLGTQDDLPLVVKALANASAAERSAARRSLIEFRGETVNKALAADIQSGASKVKGALLDVLATRRARDQMSTLLAATVDADGRVRRAAMDALGRIGGPAEIAPMLPGVLKAQEGYERDEAERDVAVICDRIENEDQRAGALIAALNTVDAARRDQLLSLVGRVGGKKLIDFVAQIATGPDASRRHLAIDALSKWPDASVAEKLFEITTHAADPAESHQAFRAFVKVSAARDGRSDRERLDRLKQAMGVARTPGDVSLVINRLRTAYDVETLRFVLPYVGQPPFAQIACETIVEIAHHREVREPHKAEVDKILDKVIATSKDPIVVERANRYKRGETWDRRSRRTR